MSQKSLNKSFSEEDFLQIKTRKDLVKIAKSRGVDISDAMTPITVTLKNWLNCKVKWSTSSSGLPDTNIVLRLFLKGEMPLEKGAPSNGLKNT